MLKHVGREYLKMKNKRFSYMKLFHLVWWNAFEKTEITDFNFDLAVLTVISPPYIWFTLHRISLPWACIKQTRGLLSLATSIIRSDFLSSDWSRGVTLPYWGSETPSNQIQTSVPSREESSGTVSAFSHCNLTVWETGPTNNASCTL